MGSRSFSWHSPIAHGGCVPDFNTSCCCSINFATTECTNAHSRFHLCVHANNSGALYFSCVGHFALTGPNITALNSSSRGDPSRCLLGFSSHRGLTMIGQTSAAPRFFTCNFPCNDSVLAVLPRT